MSDDQSSDIVFQYRELQESGLLEKYETLKLENSELVYTIKDMQQLIVYSNVESILSYIISRFIDRFVPETLVFVIIPPRSKKPLEYFYRRLVPTDDRSAENYYEPLVEYFNKETARDVTGQATPFSVIREKLPEGTFGDDFLAMHPSLIVPLSGIGGVYGIIVIGDKIVGGEYTRVEIDYIRRIFSVLAVTMQNALNYQTSITDPKTGLYTYDYLIAQISDKIALAKRHEHTYGFLMLDIDFFKKFNDTYGHLLGDKILLSMSKVLMGMVRAGDCVARFGGEEIAILFSDCDPSAIKTIAERVRTRIAAMNLEERGEALSVTVSIGGCAITSESPSDPKAIIKIADKALYHSKENGRNQCTIL